MTLVLISYVVISLLTIASGIAIFQGLQEILDNLKRK